MTSLISRLTEKLKLELPGFEAQIKMSPIKRKPSEYYLSNNPAKSAVLVLLYPKNNIPHFVLTVRQDYEGVHSGQVSFPGGKQESSDKNYIETALREAEEEIGVDVKKVNVLKELTNLYIPASNFLVNPILAFIDHEPVFKTDANEVKQLLEIPISLLLDDSTVKIKSVFMSIVNENRDVPSFDFYGHTVWGATAMMLSELRELLRRV